MMRCVASVGKAIGVPDASLVVARPAFALAMACLLATSACTVVRGGSPEPLDTLTVGALDPRDDVATEPESVMTPGMMLAATRALALERDEWSHDASGAWGTVRRTGPDDERACTPAELTVHDYRGARIERRTLCPVASFIDTL